MGIFSGLFKSRDKPQNRTAGSNYAFFFGGTTSGKAVTERSAMQMTAVYSCVRILSEAVAGLPLHLYKCSSRERPPSPVQEMCSGSRSFRGGAACKVVLNCEWLKNSKKRGIIF